MLKDENIRLLISLGLAGLTVAVILWLVSKLSRQPIVVQENNSDNSKNIVRLPLPEWMSIGDKLLVTADKTDEKEAGVNAFRSGDFSTATIKFQASLQSQPNDPEALIYLNNSKISDSNALKVAVIAPIGSSLNEAKETLRGVAQAQDEVNKSGGINGLPLQLQIASLNNFGQLNKIDEELVKDSNLLAVVGFGRNKKLYEQNSLVRVSPGSSRNQSEENYAQDLKEKKYLFNVSPNQKIFNQVLAEYIVQKERRTNVAICRDSSFRTNQNTSSTERTNQEVFKEYITLLNKAGGRVINTDCDLGAANFRASDFIARATSDGAEAILLLARPTNINPVLDVARENKGRMALFGSQQLYSERILKFGQGDVKGLVISVPWHRDANRSISQEKSFAEKAAQLWGGDVSPRTATAYDAMQVIIAGLKEDRTRQGLPKVLSNPNFSTTGATGEIKFSSLGDRQGGVFLAKIQPCESGKRCASSTGYYFELVQ
ncbi:amino acid ABC transporter substrate-binding protein [Nostoc sp. FACHB-152]|uniref:ABC transporter substrate-binding protein n=1 Tax=unclassified Nostoc TaxID=2593658 RepID=UPI0016856C68|nr:MULTISPECIES: ABC transporter substrate-binding protein [unclassified Nostoc]MBD2448312.1 amino acid ABC transporter substrate-binding protein [Nostoc sp. FACHB-152]MBD2467474.1 amino acid ABC transporter substrate-binding protein [Nostoc sp. FACHB-145]